MGETWMENKISEGAWVISPASHLSVPRAGINPRINNRSPETNSITVSAVQKPDIEDLS